MRKNNKSIIIWLFTGCFLIFLMVVIGGITRLTHSGLSIVEWNLIMGTLPPLNETQWLDIFEKYKQSPEFREINYNFSLNDFKSIFWWEYIHRLLGRIIGIVFIVPFLYFKWKKKITPQLTIQCMIIFLLGAFQGFLGWIMVKSGLIKEPSVSHYRLAAHLITAFITFGYTFWVALGLIFPEKENSSEDILLIRKLKRWLLFFFGILLIQIIYGAFVAGLKAGLAYNTFPKMGETWIAEGITSRSPLIYNFFEEIAGVQFLHRYIAYLVLFLLFFIWIKFRKIVCTSVIKSGLNFFAFAGIIQFMLGVFTLLLHVPVWLGVMHQLGAFVLFSATVYLLFHTNRYSY
jgi:heme a synthase